MAPDRLVAPSLRVVAAAICLLRNSRRYADHPHRPPPSRLCPLTGPESAHGTAVSRRSANAEALLLPSRVALKSPAHMSRVALKSPAHAPPEGAWEGPWGPGVLVSDRVMPCHCRFRSWAVTSTRTELGLDVEPEVRARAWNQGPGPLGRRPGGRGPRTRWGKRAPSWRPWQCPAFRLRMAAGTRPQPS